MHIKIDRTVDGDVEEMKKLRKGGLNREGEMCTGDRLALLFPLVHVNTHPLEFKYGKNNKTLTSLASNKLL